MRIAGSSDRVTTGVKCSDSTSIAASNPLNPKLDRLGLSVANIVFNTGNLCAIEEIFVAPSASVTSKLAPLFFNRNSSASAPNRLNKGTEIAPILNAAMCAMAVWGD